MVNFHCSGISFRSHRDFLDLSVELSARFPGLVIPALPAPEQTWESHQLLTDLLASVQTAIGWTVRRLEVLGFVGSSSDVGNEDAGEECGQQVEDTRVGWEEDKKERERRLRDKIDGLRRHQLEEFISDLARDDEIAQSIPFQTFLQVHRYCRSYVQLYSGR